MTSSSAAIGTSLSSNARPANVGAYRFRNADRSITQRGDNQSSLAPLMKSAGLLLWLTLSDSRVHLMTKSAQKLGDPELREALDRITDQFIDKDVSQQVAEVRKLIGLGHRISVQSQVSANEPDIPRYTCFQFALGLKDPPRLIITIATLYPKVYPSAEFVEYLVANHLTEISKDEIQDGDVVLYYRDGTAAHAGLVKGGLVISKWGCGHLWLHDFYEVPARYGNDLRYFRPITRGEAQLAFLRYAELKTGERFLEE